MKSRLKAVMSQFYVDGIPADIMPRTVLTWEDERELDGGIQVVQVWKWALEGGLTIVQGKEIRQ